SSIQQALDRLKQARQDMERAANQGMSQADQRRAADRLREAMNLMNGIQQKDSSGRLNSLASEAERLAGAQREQAERMRKLIEQANGVSSGLPLAEQQREKLANDRQQLSDDYGRLEKGMRDSARELASNDRPASSKVRDALTQADQADIGTRL